MRRVWGFRDFDGENHTVTSKRKVWEKKFKAKDKSNAILHSENGRRDINFELSFILSTIDCKRERETIIFHINLTTMLLFKILAGASHPFERIKRINLARVESRCFWNRTRREGERERERERGRECIGWKWWLDLLSMSYPGHQLFEDPLNATSIHALRAGSVLHRPPLNAICPILASVRCELF